MENLLLYAMTPMFVQMYHSLPRYPDTDHLVAQPEKNNKMPTEQKRQHKNTLI